MASKQDDFSPARVEIFRHIFSSIAEEMGVVLRRASFSPNIKERRDYSCAVFDANGRIIAQAAHIPVHLGSMPASITAALAKFSMRRQQLKAGDMIVLNDPYQGGTHLPDITLIMPVFIPVGSRQKLAGFVANRAHHADIGGATPGSMAVSQELFQEGLIIPPVLLVENGELNRSAYELILANVRTPEERAGDIDAQIAANRRGCARFAEIISHYGYKSILQAFDDQISYTEKLTRAYLTELPDGRYEFCDYLDNDGVSDEPIPITVAITIIGDQAVIDFTGSAPQQKGSVNAVYAITVSAVFYAVRCLIGLDLPNNAGFLMPIQIIAPSKTIINATFPAAVAGGNVETSQRIVDVLLGAFAQACPEKIPAASQGTMNNLTIGGIDPVTREPFTYYETIGGGAGASPLGNGASAIHSHMTNTLNTPVEALEYAYPMRVRKYAIRDHSGGSGKYFGGDGIVREVELLSDSSITLLTDRRNTQPYGLSGGSPGLTGKNILFVGGKGLLLPGKGSWKAPAGSIIRIETPGGGGFGSDK